MGFAEGLFLAKVLDKIKEKEPRFYEAITVYAIDFTREYEEHQLINLKKHLSKIFFVRETVFSISKLAKFDYVILNELLDDLPATELTEINGSLYLEAFCKRFSCSDRQGDIVLIPSLELGKHPNLIKDYEEIEEYKKRLGFSTSEGERFIAYLGIEKFFSNLSKLVKQNSRIWIMDYFRMVPNFPYAIETGISVEHNIGDFCNLTVHLDYFHLEKIARSLGFSIESFEEIGQRFSYPRTYNVLRLKKI